MRQETHKLFHILWTKAVGTPDYNKKEWMDLEQEIENESDHSKSSGTLPYKLEKCPDCIGRGKILKESGCCSDCDWTTCLKCHGTGKMIVEKGNSVSA